MGARSKFTFLVCILKVLKANIKRKCKFNFFFVWIIIEMMFEMNSSSYALSLSTSLTGIMMS